MAQAAAGTPVGRRELVSRLAWALSGAVLLDWAVQLLGSSTTYPWVAALVVAAGGWGLATALACWSWPSGGRRTRRWGEAWAWATVGLVLACYAAWTFLQLHAAPAYGTDEIAFDQYAASLARHGVDPYTRSMLRAFTLYRVSPDGFTYHLDGTPVTTLSYPALSFLAYVPFLLLGWSTQLAVVLNALSWAIAMVVLFVVLPREVRALGLAVGSIPVFVGYAIGGVTDLLYVPLLMGAAHGWTSFVHRRDRRRYSGPVLLGLAMCIKQTPWLLAPFLLAGLVLEARPAMGWRRALGQAARYSVAAGGAFAAPNLPYLLADPGAWWRGVLTPLSGSVVPAGQGLVGLSVFLRLGGGSIRAYTVLSVLVLAALLSAYVATYPSARAVTFLVPSAVLFFATRSFGSYLVSLLPVALVGAVTTEGRLRPAVGRLAGRDPAAAAPSRLAPARAPAGRARAAVLAGAVALPSAGAALALAQGAPLSLRVTGLRTTGQLATVEQLEVRARNLTDKALRPSFTVDEGGAVTSFWLVTKGPAVLAARSSATYTLQAPNFPAQPPIGGGFEVMAFTSRPQSVSESAPYLPGTEHLALDPEAVDAPVPVGRPVLVRAQLLDQLDRPIHEAGVPVYLGQTIYDQQGLLYSEAVVNGSLPGETPVAAYTNREGLASFVVVGTQASADPVYFEANLVNPRKLYPYGYSPILALRFVR